MSDCNSTYDPDSPLLWNRRFTSSGGEDADILVGGWIILPTTRPSSGQNPGGHPNPSTPPISDPCKARHSLGPKPTLGRTMGPHHSLMGARTQVLSRPHSPPPHLLRQVSLQECPDSDPHLHVPGWPLLQPWVPA